MSRNPRNYRDLHVQSDTLLLVDIFKNLYICNKCIETYDLDPDHF